MEWLTSDEHGYSLLMNQSSLYVLLNDNNSFLGLLEQPIKVENMFWNIFTKYNWIIKNSFLDLLDQPIKVENMFWKIFTNESKFTLRTTEW